MPRARGFALPAIAVALLVSVHVGSLSSAQRATATLAARNSAISGVVTDEATGRGLSGAVVAFSAAGLSLNAVTDSKGRFVFRNLPASDNCAISASKPGYVATGIARQFLFLRTAISLAENEWISDANIVMSRPGGIVGTVLDEKREPVVDVPVRVLTGVQVAGATYWATGPIAKTDDRGQYRIAGLPPGKYVVNLPSVQSAVPPETPQATIQGIPLKSVVPIALSAVPGVNVGKTWLVLGQYATPPPGGRDAYPALYYPNTRMLADATSIELANSEERRNVDFVIQPVSAATISGRIAGPPDVTKGLVVRLIQEGAETLGVGSEQATALAREDGTFEMANVPEGRYLLEARTSFAELNAAPTSHMPSPPGFVHEQFGAGLPWVPGSDLGGMIRTRYMADRDGYAARLPISVGKDGISNVVITLERGSTITGRIVRDDGARVPAAMFVNVEPANGDPTLASAIFDRDAGRRPNNEFAVKGVHPGRYFLRPSSFVKAVSIGGIDYTYEPFEVFAGTDVSDVVVTLTAQAASLSGAVRDKNGTLVRQAAVIVFPADNKQWKEFGLDPPRIRSTTFFGSRGYLLPRLPAGDYYVVAVDAAMRDSWLAPSFFESAAPVATRVSLSWGSASVQDLILQAPAIR